MNPFAYPKSRHTRTLSPGPFSTHSEYKPFLRQEFAKKCVYCRMPDTMKDYELYGVDHYRPKSLYPKLHTAYANLFYCCNPCNRRKRDYWPSARKTKTHFVPNPCDHEMFRHLRFIGTRVEARTMAGQVAHDLLDLDDPEVVAYRRFILDTIDTYERWREDLLEVREELLRRTAGTLSVADLATYTASNDADLAKVEGYLARLQGL